MSRAAGPVRPSADHPADAVAVVRDAAKDYRRGTERLNVRAALPWGRRTPRRRPDAHAAVDGISLELRPGEAVGVIGPNGSGKSTLLKLIAGVTLPTAGEVCTRGRVASLIELGVGFHPDLTGEENIWYTAAVLGMPRASIASRRDRIVEFAGIGDAMGTPVKRYSSGMLARLGFAVATHVDAEILTVDEVLSVGDAAFQRRSFERMRELKEDGAAIVFVSHDLWIVGQICDRVIALDEGRVVDQGPAGEVIDHYAGAGVAAGGVWGSAPVQLEDLTVTPPTVTTGGGFGISAALAVHEPTPAARLHVRLLTADGTTVSEGTVDAADDAVSSVGRHAVQGEVFSFPFSAGRYRVELSVVEGDEPTSVLSRIAGDLEVAGPLSDRASVRLHAQWVVDPDQARPDDRTADGRV